MHEAISGCGSGRRLEGEGWDQSVEVPALDVFQERLLQHQRQLWSLT